MSNIFLKNELNEIFDTATESNVSLPRWINIVDIANQTTQSAKKQQSGGMSSATSSAFMGGDEPLSATSSAFPMQTRGNALSATSSAFPMHTGGGVFSATSSATSSATFGQNGGGAFSATSSLTFGQHGGATMTSNKNNSSKDINKLISMLTSESSSSNQQGGSETSTNSLEQQLHNILSQNGGSRYNQKSGSNNKEVVDIKNFFMNLKSQGVDVNVKLNNKSMSEFFDLASNTTTDLPHTNINSESATSIFDVTNFNTNNVSDTSSVNMSILAKQIGGAKKRSSKKASKKAYKKSSKKASKKASKDLDGGVNAGFQAFLDLKKYIAEKLGVSNGPKAAKVAGAVQKDMKEKYPNLDAVSISKKGREHFDSNTAHYKQMLPK